MPGRKRCFCSGVPKSHQRGGQQGLADSDRYGQDRRSVLCLLVEDDLLGQRTLRRRTSLPAQARSSRPGSSSCSHSLASCASQPSAQNPLACRRGELPCQMLGHPFTHFSAKASLIDFPTPASSCCLRHAQPSTNAQLPRATAPPCPCAWLDACRRKNRMPGSKLPGESHSAAQLNAFARGREQPPLHPCELEPRSSSDRF